MTQPLLKRLVALALTGALMGAAGAALAHTDHAHGGHSSHGSASAPAAKAQKAWGIAGDAKAVTRTVTLTMNDQMRFTPDSLSFKQGETVRFVVKNQGKLLHELVLGTPEELAAHAAMMAKSPNMAHDEPDMVHVKAGQQGNLVWTFNRPGNFEFACLIAGHWSAGMKGRITVAAR